MRIKKTSIFILILLVISFILAQRGDNTPDTFAYRLIFYDPDGFKLSIEPLYLLVCKLFNYFHVSFKWFLFCITFFLFYLWYYLSKQIISNFLIAFFSFLPFFGFYYFGIVLRGSFAIIFILLAIIQLIKGTQLKNYFFYYLFIIIATGFHYTAFISILLPFFITKNFKSYILYIILVLTSLIPLFNHLIPLLTTYGLQYLTIINADRLSGYLNNSSQTMIYSLTLLKSLLLGFIFILLRYKVDENQRSYNVFLNVYLVGCLIFVLFSFVQAGSRLANQFLFFEFILITLLFESSKLKKISVLIFVSLIAVINFISFIQKGSELLW